ALVVTEPPRQFSLLETLRWEPGRGWTLLDRHLERLLDSAAYFDRPLDRDAVLQALDAAIRTAAGPQRVRLLVDASGEARA
ncbi:MAG: aminodeoxychorismate synthase, component I, partial [Actinobacteria bacterium]|nr:aminodeoxychorismate synthase, component I [Actinomycetota bacterium]